MPLYEVAIIEVTKHEKKDDEEKLALEPSFVLAKSDKAAGTKAFLDNAEAMKKFDSDKLQVLVRPFA